MGEGVKGQKDGERWRVKDVREQRRKNQGNGRKERSVVGEGRAGASS